jgi:hypothetical protein
VGFLPLSFKNDTAVFARVSRSERRNARSHEPVGNRLVAYLTLN